jgi:hypothetical protein
MTLSLSSPTCPTDLCYNCHATAKFHLQNPFGVFYTGIPGVSEITYHEWHNKPSGMNVQSCIDYHVSSSYVLDHDMLYMSMASSKA